MQEEEQEEERRHVKAASHSRFSSRSAKFLTFNIFPVSDTMQKVPLTRPGEAEPKLAEDSDCQNKSLRLDEWRKYSFKCSLVVIDKVSFLTHIFCIIYVT